MSPARFRWGLFLILIGVLLLLRNADILHDGFWAELVFYLPVVLIAVGIEKIFTKTRLSFISYLTSVFLFAGAIYVAAADSQRGSFFSETTYSRSYDPEVKALHATLELDATDVTIRDSGDEMIFGRFDRLTPKPDIRYRVDGQEAKVVFSQNRRSRFLGGLVEIETDEPQDWHLRFAGNIPLELECQGHESDLNLNLATTPVRRLTLDASDSDVYLRLGDLMPLVAVNVVGEDTKLVLRLPQEVGLKVAGDEYRSLLELTGLRPYDGSYITAGFDTVKSKVELTLDRRLSSVTIDFF